MQFIKKHWLIISAIGLILIALLKLTDPHTLAAGFEKRLDSILPHDRKNFDFTRTIVSLSALIDPASDTKWTENELDAMAGTLKGLIADEGNPEKIIGIFNKYFFESQGFVFDNNFTAITEKAAGSTMEELRNFHSIEKTLKRKKGICLSISLIYLMLADKLHLPIYGVLIPGHIYCRYKEPDRAGINIETTGSGFEYYGYSEGFSTLAPSGTAYGKELDKYSVVGAYLSNLGNFFMTIGQNRKAEIMFKKSIEMLPDSAEGYMNLGLLHESEKNAALAESDYNKTLELLPGNGFANYRLGAIYLSQKRFTLARQRLEEAVKAKEGGDDAVKLLEKAKNRDGG